MLYLIPVNHGVQYYGGYGNDEDEQARFKKFLIGFVNKNEIDLIAEEFNEDAVEAWNADGATCEDVADECDVEHRFCDPGLEERKELRVAADDMDGDGWDVREKYWFSQIKDELYDNETIVFVCGADHVDSFTQLLSDEGYEDVEEVHWE